VQYDLKTVNAVLRWDMIVNDRQGRLLVERHPFSGLAIPSEESPRRPRLSHADYEKMLAVADEVHPQFRLALVLAHETRHRLGALRMLSWFDVDLKARTIRWRAANDKMGFEHTTASTAWAVAALEAARGELTEAAWGARGTSADRRAGGPWRGQAAVTKLGGRSASAACPTTTRPTYSHEGRFSMREIQVFGRRLLAERAGGRWAIFYPGADGKRQVAHDVVVPEFVVTDDDLVEYLADLCHEAATATNQQVRWIT